LGRVIDPATGTAIVLPLDHPVESAGLTELERPREVVRTLAGSGIDALLMRRGLARHAVADFAGRAGWIQRITGRSGLSTAGEPHQDVHQLVIASVEDAVRNGADAVAPTFFFGRETESDAYPELGRIADECSRYDMPLVAELFPVGGPDATPYDGPYSVADMRLAVRIASEEGADLIKTYYTGDPESFAEVIRYSFVPVIIAGGPNTGDPLDLLRMARGAMDAGAVGVAFGRKIWGSRHPVATMQALIRVVREGALVEDAAEVLVEASGPIKST
jgi:fructose-bisphosphate aldolase/2-amino-3,7-dideoxy-D-threo-hept-6-ulosonate synthase